MLFVIWCILIGLEICWYVYSLWMIIKNKVRDIIDFVNIIRSCLVFFFFCFGVFVDLLKLVLGLKVVFMW